MKRDMATSDQLIAVQQQVNSIETQLRGMKHDQLETRHNPVVRHLEQMPLQ